MTQTPDTTPEAAFRFKVDMPKSSADALKAISKKHNLTLARLLVEGALALDKVEALSARLAEAEAERDAALAGVVKVKALVEALGEYATHKREGVPWNPSMPKIYAALAALQEGRRPYMGQIMAECDCTNPVCWDSGRCIAQEQGK